MLVVRLFRINKCLLLLFIIGKICSKCCFFQFLFLSTLQHCQCGSHRIESNCTHRIYRILAAEFHDTHTLCHFEFMFAVLWFSTSVHCCIKLFGFGQWRSLCVCVMCLLLCVQFSNVQSAIADRSMSQTTNYCDRTVALFHSAPQVNMNPENAL